MDARDQKATKLAEESTEVAMLPEPQADLVAYARRPIRR